MKLRLRISSDEWDEVRGRTRFRFSVVDLDKAKNYPVNFVCTMPLRLSSNEAKLTSFEKHFDDKSLEIAKRLLADALKTEEDEDIKNEIRRRLNLLEPETTCQKTCGSCGKTFKVEKRKWFRQKYCEECVKKKFGSRN